MFCKKCGTELPNGSRFCAACGENLQERGAAAAAAASKAGASVRGASGDAAVGPNGMEGSQKKIVIVLVIALATLLIALTQFHVCEFCDESYFGSGYSNPEYGIQICNDCARNYHWLGI